MVVSHGSWTLDIFDTSLSRSVLTRRCFLPGLSPVTPLKIVIISKLAHILSIGRFDPWPTIKHPGAMLRSNRQDTER